jgi:hypothetical protein
MRTEEIDVTVNINKCVKPFMLVDLVIPLWKGVLSGNNL